MARPRLVSSLARPHFEVSRLFAIVLKRTLRPRPFKFLPAFLLTVVESAMEMFDLLHFFQYKPNTADQLNFNDVISLLKKRDEFPLYWRKTVCRKAGRNLNGLGFKV